MTMEDASTEEISNVQVLRARLEQADPEAKGIDNATLRRFLRARSLNVEKALKFLLQHLQWLQDFKPCGYIDESDIKNELRKEKLFLQGVDKQGSPIAVLLASQHKTSDRDLEEFKRFVVYAFDKAIMSLEQTQEKFVLIADLEGCGCKHIDLVGYLEALKILQDHYPERLGKLFMLNVPLAFQSAWQIVSKFMDPNVRKKIVFVNKKKVLETLTNDIDISQLPRHFGGELPMIPIQHVGSKQEIS
ncbi:hypothetical protein KP509_26G004400 [Ceratopteris richardii]|uniref:CRAL-TRIO domain-containing protein n=1 Tax=Ceratopteris richardii TaxID=49495 RepID=A0A8T2RJ90_CERRI|nr:hypothetical protein KP509_26G004400 [Ceratopteris richardii]